MNGGRSTARFIEPMDCLPVTKLPEGAGWTWEIKLDGWRMEAVKTGGRVTLYSRRGKVLNAQFGSIASALQDLADETVIDGEIVAVDEEGRPNFNLLQNFRSAGANVMYFVFDVMMHKGQDFTQWPLSERRSILRSIVGAEGQIAMSESSDRPLAIWRSSSGRTVSIEGRNCITSHVCGGIHPRHSPPGVRFDQASGDRQISVCQSAGERAWPVGPRAHGREDGRMRLAEAPCNCRSPVP
jgi:hypothetical protein